MRHRERLGKLADERITSRVKEPCMEGHNRGASNRPGSLLVIPIAFIAHTSW